MRQSLSHGLLSKKQVEVLDGIVQKGPQMYTCTFWVCHRIRYVACVGKTRKLRYIILLTQCPALAMIRKELWGKSVINPLDILSTRPRRRLCQGHRTGGVLACDWSQWARLAA